MSKEAGTIPPQVFNIFSHAFLGLTPNFVGKFEFHLRLNQIKTEHREDYHDPQSTAERALVDVLQSNRVTPEILLKAAAGDLKEEIKQVGSRYITTKKEVVPNPLYLRLGLAMAAKNGVKNLQTFSEGIFNSIVTNQETFQAEDERITRLKRDPKKDFLTKERVLLLAKIARYPKLGLILLAKYSHENPKLSNIIHALQMSGVNNDINLLAEETRIKRFQTAEKPYEAEISKALDELEIAEMMQLFIASLPLKILKMFLNEDFHSNIKSQVRQTAYGNVIQKSNHPLAYILGTVQQRNEDLPIRRIVIEKAIEDLATTIPNRQNFATNPSPTRDLYFDFSDLPTKDRMYVINKLYESHYKGGPVNNVGLPLPEQVIDLLEANINDPIALEFLFSHYASVIKGNVARLQHTDIKGYLDITIPIVQVAKSLRRIAGHVGHRPEGEEKFISPLIIELLRSYLSQRDIIQKKLDELSKITNLEIADLNLVRLIMGQLISSELFNFIFYSHPDMKDDNIGSLRLIAEETQKNIRLLIKKLLS